MTYLFSKQIQSIKKNKIWYKLKKYIIVNRRLDLDRNLKTLAPN